MLQITLAALHLFALAIGLPGVLTRGRALGVAARELPHGSDALRRAFDADSRWGIAAAIWIGTGLWRWLGDTEKSTEYYNRNHLFLAKMTFLAVILMLEIWPMVTLVRWRVALRRGDAAAIAAPRARGIAVISYVQALLVVTMVFLAAAMARGFGARPGG
jgi:putative membrane protein